MITLRPLPFTAALVLLASGCPGDDSGTTTDAHASSTGTVEPSTGSSTAADPTTAADSSGDTTTASSSSSSGDSTGPADTEGSESTGAAGLELAGTWLEEFSPGMGITHVIDESTWEQQADFGDALFHVSTFDAAARTLVAQGDATNEFFPDLYSRFDWTWDGDALYYCTAVYDAATAEDAAAASASDPGDLATGCGGFPWSLLLPVR